MFATRDRDLHLFFKVGREISIWRTWRCVSKDNGETWSVPVELCPGVEGEAGRGPVRCKPIYLAEGSILAPASDESIVWRAFTDRSSDGGHAWIKSPFLYVSDGDRDYARSIEIGSGEFDESRRTRGLIQPTLWQSASGGVHMLLRTTVGCVYRSDSADDGMSWTKPYRTTLPSNNSGIDLVRHRSGLLVLAYNPTMNSNRRTPLTIAVSGDDGETWKEKFYIETGTGEYSYPSIIVGGDVFCVTYTWNRKRIGYCTFHRDFLEREARGTSTMSNLVS